MKFTVIIILFTAFAGFWSGMTGMKEHYQNNMICVEVTK